MLGQWGPARQSDPISIYKAQGMLELLEMLSQVLSCWGSYLWGLWWQFWSSTAQDLYGRATLSFSVQSWAHGWSDQFLMKRPHDAGRSCEGGRLRCFLGVARLLSLDLAWLFIWTSLWHLGPLNRMLSVSRVFRLVWGQGNIWPTTCLGTIWCHTSLTLCPGLHAVTSWWICMCSILLGYGGAS